MGSPALRDVLRIIALTANRRLASRKPWEDGALDVGLPLDGLSPSELQLVDEWISAWRARIIKANGIKPGA